MVSWHLQLKGSLVPGCQHLSWLQRLPVDAEAGALGVQTARGRAGGVNTTEHRDVAEAVPLSFQGRADCQPGVGAESHGRPQLLWAPG